MEQFLHMHEKLMLSDMQSVHWSKTMDICAVLYKNNSIEVYRVGEQLQKLFVIDEEEQITNVEVEANFIFYTYGTKLSGYDLSTHSQVIQSIIRYEAIQGLFLIPVEIEPIKPKKIFQKLVPLPNTQLRNWQSLSFLKSRSQNYITLTTHENLLNISLNGITGLCHLNDIRVNYVQHSKNELHLFTETQIQVYDFSDYKNPKELKYMQQHSYLYQLLNFLKSSVVSINNSLGEIYKSYQLNILGLEKFEGIQQLNKQFLAFYQKGECSQQLFEFFQKDLYNTKVVPKLDEKIQQSLNYIQEIIQESVLNVLQESLLTITHIENYLVAEKETHKDYIDTINKLKGYLKLLSQMFIKFQLECHQTKLHLRNFCIWLNKCAIKSQPEVDQDCENVNHPLGKMDCNLQILYDFLIDEHIFNLRNLASFFSDKIAFKTFFSDPIYRKRSDVRIQHNVCEALQAVFQSPISFPANNKNQVQEMKDNITQIIRDMQNNLESMFVKSQLPLIRIIDIGPLRPLFSKTEDDYVFINFGREIQEFYYKKGAFLPGKLLNLQIDDGQFYNDEFIYLQKQQQGYILTNKDRSIEYAIQNQRARNLQISKRGLLSLILDNNKILILSLQ